MTTRRVKLDITEISDDLYYAILAEFYLKFGKDVSFVDWEVSAEIEAHHESDCPAIDGFGCRCSEAV
jgi:hypothetical protein